LAVLVITYLDDAAFATVPMTVKPLVKEPVASGGAAAVY